MLRRSLQGGLLFCVVLGLVAGAGVASAKLKTRHPIAGSNSRAQIGGGLPLPITLTPPPNGRILPISGATLRQTTGPDPKMISIPAAQLTNPAAPQFQIGVFTNNSALFSVQSNLGFQWPGKANGPAIFHAGGRTGATTYTFTPGGSIPGNFKYTATGSQFGGAAQGRVTGTAKVWAIAAAPPPCSPGPTCIAVKIVANPALTQAGGGAFGFTNATSPVNQVPGIYVVGANAAGSIFFRTPTPNSNPGPTNAANSAGAPWTTGVLTVNQPAALGAPEVFVLSGSDGRVGGVGTISLVSGALSTRTLSGPNANRGWLNLVIGAGSAPVPGVSSWGVAVVAALTLGSVVFMGRRLFATTS